MSSFSSYSRAAAYPQTAANVLPGSAYTTKPASLATGTYMTPNVTSTAVPTKAAKVLSSSQAAQSFPTGFATMPSTFTTTGPTPRYVSPTAATSPTQYFGGTPTITTMAPTVTRAAPTIISTMAPVTMGKVEPAGFKLKLGAEIPNFDCVTTHGNFPFHQFISNGPDYTVLFSHPADFTPVCTTELGRCEVYGPEFEARGVQLIGLSCDDTASHLAWTRDILAREKIEKPDGKLSFPIIADPARTIAGTLGMLDPEEIGGKGIPLPARALIVIDKTKKVKLSILYPATTGRNFEEVLRVIDSLILTKDKSLATPADWRQGDRCIVAPSVSTEDAAKKFEDLVIEDLPSKKQYLRHVQCPAMPGAALPASDGLASGLGISTEPNTRAAVQEAVSSALQSCPNPALVFASCTCDRDVGEVQAAFAELLPGVPLHGLTSSGNLLHPTGSFPNGVGCLAIQAPPGAFATAIADTVEDAANMLAQQMPQPQAIIMSTVPGSEEGCIEVLNQVFGIPVYGGTAADNELKGEWRVFGQGGVTEKGISIIGVGPGVKFGGSMVGPYVPTETKAVITKGEGRRVLEINGAPAADWVYDWLGKEVENEYINGGLILPQTAQKPIGFPLPSGQFQSAHLAALGGPEKYVEFFTPIQEGMEMTIMTTVEGAGPETGYAQTLADAYSIAAENGGITRPAAGVLIFCGGMAIAVGEQMNAGLTAGLGGVADVPILGMACFGEQAFIPEDGMNLQRNLSCGFLLFE